MTGNVKLCDTAERMLNRVSPVYEESYGGKWLFSVIGNEMEEAKHYFDELRLQAFPETATWGLSYWEQCFGISEPAKDMEERRNTILMRRSIRSPMNPARVAKIAGDFCGRPIEVLENSGAYTFSLLFREDTAADLQKLTACIKRIKPSHLSFFYLFRESTDNILSAICQFGYRCDAEQEKFTKEIVGTLSCVNIKADTGHKIIFIENAAQKQSEQSTACCRTETTNEAAVLPVSVVFREDAACQSSYNSVMTEERSLWTLSGTDRLDGSRRLDAEILFHIL